MSYDIPVYRAGRQVATTWVDSEDLELAESCRWFLSGKGYAARTEGRGVATMHRQIMGLVKGDGLVVDHIDQDKLNNRRSNLRVCTHAENMQNIPSRKGCTSRFRGVHASGDKWVAKAYHGSKCVWLGTFTDEVEAAIAADSYRLAAMLFAKSDPELYPIYVERGSAHYIDAMGARA